jgi:hypothetical protein
MKFILTFTLPPETRNEAIARFLETEGQPPLGVTLLGRWTQLDLSGGYVLLESEDSQALTAFAHSWSDLLELTLAPVIEDQALAGVLRRASSQPVHAEGLSQAAAIVADQELPDGTHPEGVHGDLRAEEPATARPTGRRRTQRGAETPAALQVEADPTGEAITVPPPPAVPGGLEGEGEEPESPKTKAERAGDRT